MLLLYVAVIYRVLYIVYILFDVPMTIQQVLCVYFFSSAKTSKK